MEVRLTDDQLEIRLARWEKALGLLGDITVPRGGVSDVKLVEDPVREAMGGGMKAGLRIPWVYFVARSLRLDQAWIVRRGVPGLSFAVSESNKPALRHVTVSTPDAQALVLALTSQVRTG